MQNFSCLPCSCFPQKFGVCCLLLTEDQEDSSEIKSLQIQIKFRKISHKLKFGAEVWISARLKVDLDVCVNSKIARVFFFLEGREEGKCGSIEGFSFSVLQILNYSHVI